MMKCRSHICALIAGLLVFGLLTPSADAAIGPKRLQRLAERQTQLLLRNYSDGDVASPDRCNKDQSRKGTKGVFLLPTRFGGAGDLTFTCKISTRTVLLDLGGAVATEDANPESVWTLSTTGEVLRFTPATIERICEDILNVVYLTPAAATLDGVPISGKRVSTRAFVAKVRPAAEGLYADSVAVGHPGKLATSYCGWKTTLRLKPGRHVIVVDLLAPGETDPSTFTYNIYVKKPKHS